MIFIRWLQAPLAGDREEARCMYAMQLKTWYDEQYNDWASRYVREKLYRTDGVQDRAADYVYTNLLRNSISPTKHLGNIKDKEYIVTECTPSATSPPWECQVLWWVGPISLSVCPLA